MLETGAVGVFPALGSVWLWIATDCEDFFAVGAVVRTLTIGAREGDGASDVVEFDFAIAGAGAGVFDAGGG